MKPTHLTLREYDTVYLRKGSNDYERDRLSISKKHFRMLKKFDEQSARSRGTQIFQWYDRRFKAQNWVGVMQVEDLCIEVLPKIDNANKETLQESTASVQFSRSNLLTMLAIAGDIPLRVRDLATQSTQRAPIMETLVRQFAEKLFEELQLGTHRAYLVHAENLKILRGKILYSHHLKHNFARRDRFYVEHDTFSSDNLLNQILKATCKILVEYTNSSISQELLALSLIYLDEVSDRAIQHDDFSRVFTNRQNDRFKELLNFCELVVTGYAPTASAGDMSTFALFFDMESVFERFIAAFIRKYVVKEPGIDTDTVCVQSRSKNSRYLLHHQASNKGILRLNPDIILHDPDSGVAMTIIDTKWKHLDSGKRIRQGVAGNDLYQLFAYSQRYNCPNNILLFPWIHNAQPVDFDVIAENDAKPHQKVSVRFVRLDDDLTTARGRENLRKNLMTLVRPLAQSTASTSYSAV